METHMEESCISTSIAYNAGTVVIGRSVPRQNRIDTLFLPFDARLFILPEATTTIGIDADRKMRDRVDESRRIARMRDRIDAFHRIASERYDGDAAAMLNAFLAEGAGAADIALIAWHLGDRIVLAQSLRRVEVDIDALRDDDGRRSYLRFSNDSEGAVAFDAAAGPPDRMLACLPMRYADDMVAVVYPDGSRHRTPIARQALYLLIDALHQSEPSFLDYIYVAVAERDVVPEPVRSSIEIRISSGCDVSRTTGRVFDWNGAAPDDFPIGLATGATIAVVRDDGSDIVSAPLVGDVVLPFCDGERMARPTADVVASLLDVRFPQPKRFIVYSEDITDRTIRLVREAQRPNDRQRAASRLIALAVQAFSRGVAPMLVRGDDEEDNRRHRRYLMSSGVVDDIVVDFPAALCGNRGKWTVSDEAIGRLAQTIVRLQRSNVAVRLVSCAPFDDIWLLQADAGDDGPASIVISHSASKIDKG
jgi:hypothetical protein